MLKIKKMLVSQPKPTSEKSPYFDIASKYNVQIDFRIVRNVTTVVFFGKNEDEENYTLCSI